MAQLLRADGTEMVMIPANGKSFTLRELQEAVGGYIELCRTHSGAPMFINEEGKLRGLPYNAAATAAYRFGSHPGYSIMGDAVICSEEEAG